MSTRSGKKLHKVSNENIESQIPLKVDRKTRSKRVVENSDSQGVVVKEKKRQNYVTFPSEEDSTSGNSLEDEVPAKAGRSLRRYTLKEQNAVTEDVDTATSTKTQARSTRRSKKFSETEEVPDVPVNEDPAVSAKPKGKKNKKKTKKVESEIKDKENVKAGKTKKNKKKNSKSNSVEVESNRKRKNDSNVSTDSFHSAAGSPLQKQVNPPSNSSPKHTGEDTLPTQNTSAIKRRSSLKRASELNTSTKAMDVDEDNIEKEAEISVRSSKRRRSSLKPITPAKDSTSPDTIEKVDLNTTFEKEPTNEGSSKKKRKSNLVTDNTDPVITNLDIPKTSKILNTTFEKDDIENDVKSKNNKEQKSEIINASFEIRRSPRKSVNASEVPITLNGTFDLSPKPDLAQQKSLNSTYEKESKLDSTFDKTDKPSLGSKSSLISSDATNNSIISLDRSDNSKITDDDSKTENILNTTPLLIESSMEESRVLESSLKENKTPESLPEPSVTPLKREGTFTKDSPSMSPKRTPNKRVTLPAAGCTPYHSNGKVSQKRSVLNLTHSIEKSGRRSSLAEVPRTTRVMFCSPVNNPGVATQRKSKIIKSNLKGSNKSFVFDESECQTLQPSRLGRKRSFTHAEGAPASAKRARLAAERAPPARARAASATGKLTNGTTPSKPATPKSEVKTKLPNFAALHARRFQRMESLDECQQRKARRAKQLLVPTGSVAVLERSSPRGESHSRPTTPKDVETKLPNFQRMESLDECQQRKARRAKQLLVPTGSVAVLERSSPRGESHSRPTTPKDVETKLPNFQRMESLDECQQRKARRAKQLLVPTGSVAVLERSSPRGESHSRPTTPKDVETKLPNFQRMESLDECQQRKARRAKQLLVPTGSVAVLERSSPRGESHSRPTTPKDVETKLPNFQRMESLDECQQRKARRAKQLLVPTGSVAVLERSSPRGESHSRPTTPKDVETKLPNFQRMESLDECQQRKARRAKQLLVPTGSVAVLERSSPRGESHSRPTTPKDVETKLPNFQRMESLDECQQRKARRAKQLLVPTGSVAVLERSSPRGESHSRPTTPKDVETKLPNFQRMESLDECQQRKARRAKQLLVPTGSVAVLERSSPRVTLEPKPRDTPPKAATPAKSASKLPTLETLQRGYTRFGFKMQCDVNPFSVPPKTTKPKVPNCVKSRENRVKPNGAKLNGVKLNGVKPTANLKREVIQPSLAGATSLRRAAAQHTVMREKSFTLAEKRNESRNEVRTVIKGVRTNRRFELQMQCRNLNG